MQPFNFNDDYVMVDADKTVTVYDYTLNRYVTRAMWYHRAVDGQDQIRRERCTRALSAARERRLQ